MPTVFTAEESAGLRGKTPERSYRYIYPADVDLDRVAYFFDYRAETDVPESGYAAVRSAVAAWSDAWQAETPPRLTYWHAPHFVQIRDQRHQGQDGTYTFQDTLADLYMACTTRPTTAAAVRRNLDLRLPADAIQEIFGEFERRGLMFIDGEFALALALPAVKSR